MEKSGQYYIRTKLPLSIASQLVGLAILLFLTGCTSIVQADDDLSQRKVRVVATTGMIADAVRNVGGERVDASGLMGPGVDPHLYKASEGDVTTLAEADIIFYNGLHLEAQMGRVFERIEGRIRAVAVTSQIDLSLLVASADYEGTFDPHVWFDVTLWMKAVETVRDSLVELDPVHRDIYESNAESYLAELSALHNYVTQQAQKVPVQQRVIITAHDAFGYFGKAYGFEVLGLQGISTATEASAADVNELANFIAENRIPAIFVEASVPTRTIEAVQAAVRARGLQVVIGGELFSDSLGTSGTPEETYLGMVRHNVDTIVSALSVEAAVHNTE
jgi:manganese/zinc/iron transport system substrate-binding protein